MARGWESKSVEDQISSREAGKAGNGKRKRSVQEAELQAKRESILLARSRTVTAMESSRDERYRALLKRTLDHLDAELQKLA